MVSDDVLFHFFTTFSPLPYAHKSTRLKNIYTLQQRILPHQKEFSVQYGEFFLDISYWTLWLTLQCALQYSLILSILILYLTCWFHSFWFLYIENHYVNRRRVKGDRHQLINFKNKGNRKIRCNTKSLLILTGYQVQRW